MSRRSRRTTREAEVDVRITHVWKEPDHRPNKNGQYLVRYRLADSEGSPIGEFCTPSGSQLASTLLAKAMEQ